MSTIRHIPVLIFGAGGVGQALLHQIMSSCQRVAGRNSIRFDLVGIVDSRSWLWQPDGLSESQIHAGLDAKRSAAKMLHPSREVTGVAVRERVEARKALHERRVVPLGADRPDNLAIIEQLIAGGIEKAIVVDVTAADGMEPAVSLALEAGYGVVLANKKPLAGPWSSAQGFYHHPRLRHESTVGGGQPVIATLRMLLDTNDPVYRIEGQLSGTLGFICNQLDRGMPFSHALLAAKVKGYTEPDPREDLSGMDVMRKVLILARMAGWTLEASDIAVESLYPRSLAHLSVEEFMQASVAIDPSMKDRVNAAAAAGEVLRYVAEVEAGRGNVGLKAVPLESPVANLKYISFRTGHYDDEPLMIAGKGAGVGMTAAGALGDMIDLAREM